MSEIYVGCIKAKYVEKIIYAMEQDVVVLIDNNKYAEARDLLYDIENLYKAYKEDKGGAKE